MTTLLLLALCGAVGGLLFEYLNVPGGAMTGAMIAVILCKMLLALPQVNVPKPVATAVYIGLGIIVGNMFRPEMLLAVKDTWPILLISSLLVLLAGMIIAVFVYKFGHLDVTSAYLATSPGGLNAVVALAAGSSPNAPMVLAYQIVRLYAIIFTVPLISKVLQRFLH